MTWMKVLSFVQVPAVELLLVVLVVLVVAVSVVVLAC